MSGGTPRLSIILVTRNRVKIFARSLDSVLREVEQDYPEAEVVVIDGGSTDGTADLLRQKSERLAYWISEPDRGVADAVNKGLRQARGEIVRIVGDDDELIPGRIRLMMDAVDKLGAFDIVSGHNVIFQEIEYGKAERVAQKKFWGEVTKQQLFHWGPNAGILIPESCYFRRNALLAVGGYDESFKWWGFLDLFYRMLEAGSRLYVVPVDIMISYQTPQSDTFSNLKNEPFVREFERVLFRHRGIVWGACYRGRQKMAKLAGGSLAPRDVMDRLVEKLGAKTGFHPRAILRKWLRRADR